MKAAAALFLLYAVLMMLNAAALAPSLGWASPREVTIALVRLAAAALVAWALLRGSRWGWWLGLVLGILWLGEGLLPLVVMDRGDLHWLAPSGAQLLLAGALLSLAGALTLLVLAAGRAALRRDPQGPATR
jgi:hypothetical protein